MEGSMHLVVPTLVLSLLVAIGFTGCATPPPAGASCEQQAQYAAERVREQNMVKQGGGAAIGATLGGLLFSLTGSDLATGVGAAAGLGGGLLAGDTLKESEQAAYERALDDCRARTEQYGKKHRR